MASGSFGGSGLIYISISWSSTANPVNNKSKVSCTMYLHHYAIDAIARSDVTISCNGVTKTLSTRAVSGGSYNSMTATAICSASFDVDHNASGSKSVSISGKYPFYGKINGVQYNVLECSNTVSLDNIDRAGPSITNLSTNWVSATRASIHFSVDCEVDRLRYKVGASGAYTVLENSVRDFNISGLTPNYTRPVYIEARRKYNQVVREKSFDVTTPKPSAPNKGTVSVSNVTLTSADISWSGFSFNEGADWGHYEVSQGDNPDSWRNVGKNTSWTDSRLAPNTKYRWVVKLFDNYGTSSGAVYSDFVTTPKPPAPKLANFQVEIVSPFIINIFPGQGTFSDYSTLDHYDFNIDGGGWLNGGSKAFSIRNLIPGKTYKVGLRIVDNYGTASVPCYATFTMPFDQIKLSGNDNGVWKTILGFTNVNGTWMKIDKGHYCLSSDNWVRNVQQ